MVARVIEEHGIATVTLTAMRDVVEAVKPPRAVLLKFPFGSPLGRPGDADKHCEVIKAALALLEIADEGGVIVEPDIRYSSPEEVER